MFLDSVFNYIFGNIFPTFLQLALYKKFPRELAQRKKCLNDLIKSFKEAPNVAPNERYCYIEATSNNLQNHMCKQLTYYRVD